LNQRLHHLADGVTRKAIRLAQIDQRLLGPGFGQAEAAGLPDNAGLAEQVNTFAARVWRLQDTLGAALLPRLLMALLGPTGSVAATPAPQASAMGVDGGTAVRPAVHRQMRANSTSAGQGSVPAVGSSNKVCCWPGGSRYSRPCL
jgi:hypothetical protein